MSKEPDTWKKFRRELFAKGGGKLSGISFGYLPINNSHLVHYIKQIYLINTFLWKIFKKPQHKGKSNGEISGISVDIIFKLSFIFDIDD